MRGKVYLVGAGPGDYKLMTLKGMECIKEADVIVYDRLANINYLKQAKPNCEFINVGKASSNHLVPQDDINRIIADKAKEGKIVTRLKGGDPYVFGRGAEEGQLLKEEGVEFEVVPGITSAIGGLCYAGIPITHRDYASSFHVVTGHLRNDDKENEEINWNALANVRGTLVFLMGVANLQKISTNLIKEGKSKDTPVALISWATRPNQSVLVTTLENAYEDAIKNGVKPPTLIAVGQVVNLRQELSFFENKPLFGKNVAVTRARVQNSSLIEKINDLGGNAIEIPTIKIDKIENNIELEKEIMNISKYTYIVLTSKNGVDIFFDKLEGMNLDTRALANLKVCAIGDVTAREIKKKGIIADIVPATFIGEELYKSMTKVLTKDDSVLVPRASNARDYLVDKLSEICTVKEVHTYNTVVDTDIKEDVIDIIENQKIDYITFASSSTVNNFVEIIGQDRLELIKNLKVISIGPVTSDTIRKHNINLYKESQKATINSMVETIIQDAGEKQPC